MNTVARAVGTIDAKVRAMAQPSDQNGATAQNGAAGTTTGGDNDAFQPPPNPAGGSPDTWSYEDALESEASLLHYQASPVCLDRSTEVFEMGHLAHMQRYSVAAGCNSLRRSFLGLQ